MAHPTRARRRGQPAADPIPFVRGLCRLVPPERVDHILRLTGRMEKRRRRLPARSVVWLVIAMALFSNLSIPEAFRALHPSEDGPDPDDSAFTKARRRLGVEPLRELFREVSAPAAPPSLPGAFYRGLRLMGIDGTVLDVPDTPDNEQAFGRVRNHRAPCAFPQIRVLALCELGTHQACDFAARPLGVAEQPMVADLLPRPGPGMLLLWDRNFFSYEMIRDVSGRGRGLLARVKAGLPMRRAEESPDGSCPSKVYPTCWAEKTDKGGTVVRIVEYTHDDPGRPGRGERVRLLTTVLDPEEMPALEAAVLYHERWEQELVFDEIKTHLNERDVPLRSKTPEGVEQESYGLTLAHRVVRQVMRDAALAKGEGPDRLSFVDSPRVPRAHLPEAPRRPPEAWYRRLVREVGWQESRPRRERWYPRVIKKKMKQWAKKRPIHVHPPQPTKRFTDAVLII